MSFISSDSQGRSLGTFVIMSKRQGYYQHNTDKAPSPTDVNYASICLQDKE